MNKKKRQKIIREFISELFLFSFSIGAVSLFWGNNLIAFLIMIFGLIIGSLVWHTKDDRILFLVGAIGGPIAEIICIKFGAWQYTNPDFLGIPIWLIPLWGIATLFLDRVRITIRELRKN